MKNNYLLAALMTLIVMSCKKETKELTGDQPTVSLDDYTVCTGSNTWENDVTHVGDRPELQVVYNNKVYFFNNNLPDPNDPFRDKITIYDGTSWQVLSSDIPFEPIYIGFGFVIGNKGYFGYTQYAGNVEGKSWEYNFITNTWAETESFPGYYVMTPAYFTVANKGYVVGGYVNHSYSNETWEFDPSATPKWRKRANYPGTARSDAEGFSIGNKGYIVNGETIINDPYQKIYHKTLLEYNPSANIWTIKASFPGAGRRSTKSFVIAGYAYVGGGLNNDNWFIDFYKYDPVDNDWVRTTDYSATGELWQAFSLNSKGYAVFRPYSPQPFRLKKFTPRICTTISTGPTIP